MYEYDKADKILIYIILSKVGEREREREREEAVNKDSAIQCQYEFNFKYKSVFDTCLKQKINCVF